VVNVPRRIIVTAVAVVVLVGGAVLGRHLLGGTTAASSIAASTPGPSDIGSKTTVGPVPSTTMGQTINQGANAAAGTLGSPSTAGTTPASGSTSGGALPRVPVFAIAPQIVRTATIDLRVGKNTLSSALTNIATLAAADGGYVESSSMGGGTARTAPVTGSVVIHVLDSDFSQAMATLSGYGKVTNQSVQGKDVTNQVATNDASIAILQDEVNLLQGKLGQATDIDTFLQIQNQLFPVEEQLQQLQNQQAVLENSAALATITTNLSAPGAPLVTPSPVRASTNTATVAWRYLRHNSLAVLDGLAVGTGWALPVLVLLALIWLAGSRIIRRRRHAINPV
jgi:hypothetical protein